MNLEKINNSFNKLKCYCEDASFKGYDPYDGLNSKLFRQIPILKKSVFAKLCWIQFFKKSPVNFRKLAWVEPGFNSKAVGLFLSTYCEMYKFSPVKETFNKMNYLVEKLLYLKSNQYSNSSWGYNFDWQSRAFYQPANTPNIVTSSFVANAILDMYDITGDEKLLLEVRSTGDFIINDLNRTFDKSGNIAFSYSPLDYSVVYNASLLGARLLARIYSKTQEIELLNISKSVLKYCCQKQNTNGSWSYGTFSFHKWIDNFHTGYNLECISDYAKFTNDNSFNQNLTLGFDYYINNFFTEQGLPKYYNNNLYPIDIHSSAQLVITLHKLDKMDEYKALLDKLLNWTIDNMQSKNGSFFYQKKKYYTIKIPYMRWSQAWMMLSMSIYLSHFNKK